jgi:DNA polymerase III subunit delta
MPRDHNVVLLYGNDEYAMRRRIGEFESMFTDPSSASMNTARLEARTMTDDELNNAVNSMPFLAKQRLVLLSNPSARYTTPQARKKFFEFVEKVPPTARLIILEDMDLKSYRDKSRQEKEDEKHWLVKWVKKAGLGLERCGLPAQWEMTGWIVQQAQEQGGQIEQGAAARLAEMVGPNPQQAAQEIAKLLTYVNWSRPVKLEDVQAVSIVTAEADVFKMVDELAAGNGHAAQRLLHKLIQDEGAFGIWGAIIRQFRFILLAREVMEQGGSIPEVQKALGPNTAPFIAEKAYAQAKRLSLPALERIYHRLVEIDEAAKTGKAPLDVSLEMLVAELTA